MKPAPRYPVLGWRTFSGPRAASLPCLLDHPRRIDTTSGRAALWLGLRSLGVAEGDRVLVPAYHCPSMVAPLVACGARPLFYPTDAQGRPQLSGLDAADLGPTRALLVMHGFGLPQPMAPWRRWCDERGIALIEDCAHALFGSSDGRSIGAWGDIAVGSLTKFLPVTEGGCLLLNRADLVPPALDPVPWTHGAKALLDTLEHGALNGRLPGLAGPLLALRTLRQRLRGRTRTVGAAPDGAPPPRDADFSLDLRAARRRLSLPSRWLAGHAPRGRMVDRRRHHFRAYLNALAGSNRFRPLVEALPDAAAPYVFPLWIEPSEAGYRKLHALGVAAQRWDRLWPDTPRIDGDMGIVWSRQVVQLPCHQDISDGQRSDIVDAVTAAFGVPGDDGLQ